MQLHKLLRRNTMFSIGIACLAVRSFAADTAAVLMDMNLEDLLNMQVTTTSKQAEKISDAPGVISVVTRDEMERFGARTLKEVLLRVPSVALSTYTMSDRSSIAVRGDQLNPTACHTLLLINGRPVREALEGGIKSEMYESFPVSVIDHIEVIRGPGSVLYGSNAFSAVINVITKKGNENTTNLEIQGGNPAAFLGDGSAAYQIGDFNVIAGLKYYKEKEWTLGYIGSDGITKYNVSVPNNGVGSYLELNYKNLKIMSSYEGWTHFFANQVFLNPQSGLVAMGDVFFQKSFNDIGYTQKITDWWNASFNATYTNSWLDVDTFLGRSSFDLTGEWTNFFKPVNNLNIVLGVLGNYVKGEMSISNATVILDTSRSSMGIYLQADYKLHPTLKLIAGLQGNKVPGFDFDFNPRAGFIWSPQEIVNIKALYSQAFRAPTIQELYMNILGNPDLKPEKVNTFDFGVNIQTDKASIGLNNYYSQISNNIIETFPPHYENVNQKTTIIGMELEGKYYVTKELLLTGSGLYQQNTNNDSLGNIMPVPEAGAKGGISYSSKGLTVSVYNIYEGKLDKRYTSLGNPNPVAYNLLNANIGYDFNKLLKLEKLGKIALNVEGYNLLGDDIWLPASGSSSKSASLPVTHGRSIHSGIDVSF
jgi:outer membrane receptor for ferrienterochelin and colicins